MLAYPYKAPSRLWQWLPMLGVLAASCSAARGPVGMNQEWRQLEVVDSAGGYSAGELSAVFVRVPAAEGYGPERPYGADIEVRAAEGQLHLECEAQEGAYRCLLDGSVFFSIDARCERGELASGASVLPWYEGELLRGYTVRQDEGTRAAFQLDRRPRVAFLDAATPETSERELALAAILLSDLLAQNAERAFMCDGVIGAHLRALEASGADGAP
ncbi:MAG: hypothetical protein AAF411_26230 [Myxococcota bacterium]